MSGTTLANIGTAWGNAWDNAGEYLDNLVHGWDNLKKGVFSK